MAAAEPNLEVEGILNHDGVLTGVLSDNDEEDDNDNSEDEVEELMDLLKQAGQGHQRSRRAHKICVAISVNMLLFLNIPAEPYYLHPNRIRSISRACNYWKDERIFAQQFRLSREHFIILAAALQIPTFIRVGKYVLFRYNTFFHCYIIIYYDHDYHHACHACCLFVDLFFLLYYGSLYG